jgi:hypothetical protein
MNGWDYEDFKRALDTVKTPEGINTLRSVMPSDDVMTRDAELDEGAMDEEVHDDDDDVFKCLFYHYGGRIREAAQCVSGRSSMQAYIAYVIALVESASMENVSLCWNSTECSADPNSKDSLRRGTKYQHRST